MDCLPTDVLMIILECLPIVDIQALYLAYRVVPSETILRKLSGLHNLPCEDNLADMAANSLLSLKDRYNRSLKIGNYRLTMHYLPDRPILHEIFESNLTIEEQDDIILHIADFTDLKHQDDYLNGSLKAKHYKLVHNLLIKYPTLSIPSYKVGTILKNAPLDDLESLLPLLPITCLNSYDVNSTKEIRRILIVRPYLGDAHQSININNVLDISSEQVFDDLKFVVDSIGWKYCYDLNDFALKAITTQNVPIIDLLATQGIPYLISVTKNNPTTLEFVLLHSYLKTKLPYSVLLEAIQDNDQDSIKILYKHGRPLDRWIIIEFWKSRYATGNGDLQLLVKNNKGIKYAGELYECLPIIEGFRCLVYDDVEAYKNGNYMCDQDHYNMAVYHKAHRITNHIINNSNIMLADQICYYCLTVIYA